MSFDGSFKLGAKKFHKKRQFAYNLTQIYRKKFFKSGKIKKKLLEKRNCPICKTKNNAILFLKGGGTHKKCKKCEMIYLDPVFKDKELEIEDFALELINLQEKRFGSNGDMIKQRIKLLQPIQDQVLTIIQEIAKEKKYDFIFDRSSEGTMLYSAKNYDISDLVIKRLNRNKKIQERKEKIEDLKNKAKN